MFIGYKFMLTVRFISIFLVLSLSSCTTTGVLNGFGQAANWLLNRAEARDSEFGQIQGEWTAMASAHKFIFQTATNGYYLVNGNDKAQSFRWNRTGQVVNVSAVGGRSFVFSLTKGKLKGVVDDKEMVLVKSDS
jgi:hypothetical protein